MTAWIMGRVLGPALSDLGTGHRFGRFRSNRPIALDLNRDAEVLGRERSRGLPFATEDGLFATIHDFKLAGGRAVLGRCKRYELANLRFTHRALESAAYEFVSESTDNLTRQLCVRAQALSYDDRAQVLRFSEDVVATWGRGGRVWGNLMKRHHANADDYAARIAEWLRKVPTCRSPAQALEPGLRIKGLDVSFASKHLRMVDPDRYGVLDDVISRGLGYALNPAGYTLWLHDLSRLKATHALAYRLGDLEGAIFALVRQRVRTGTPL